MVISIFVLTKQKSKEWVAAAYTAILLSQFCQDERKRWWYNFVQAQVGLIVCARIPETFTIIKCKRYLWEPIFHCSQIMLLILNLILHYFY